MGDSSGDKGKLRAMEKFWGKGKQGLKGLSEELHLRSSIPSNKYLLALTIYQVPGKHH